MYLAVEEGRISSERLIKLLASNAQRIFNLHPDAETYSLVNTDAHYTIDRANLRTKCGWSPFEGMRVPGRVVGVWIRGHAAAGARADFADAAVAG
jgi:dihydroorotase-like cyclic amidohydrolase